MSTAHQLVVVGQTDAAPSLDGSLSELSHFKNSAN